MDWKYQPEIRRPVDAVLLNPLDDDRIRESFMEALGAVCNPFVPSAGDVEDILSDYLERMNQGRPFILVGDHEAAARSDDLAVASYSSDMMADAESIREDARSRIASFIGTRTYCLRERVEGD